jgi:membrane-associated phospholipid phosphatase
MKYSIRSLTTLTPGVLFERKLYRKLKYMFIKKFFMILMIISLKADAQNPDIDLAKHINPNQPNSGFWEFTSNSAYYVSAAIPFCMLAERVIAKDHSFKQNSFNEFAPIIIELIISESMKSIVNRKRPAESYPDLISPYSDATGRSFPSGHTSLVFAAAASLSIQYKRWYVSVPAYTYASMVGYSRIYLGVHYPTDVIAGAIVGVGSAYLSNWLNKKLFSKKRSKPYSTNN